MTKSWNTQSQLHNFHHITDTEGRGLKCFSGLTDAQRTVICSVLYQYGSPRRIPRFWGFVTSQVSTHYVWKIACQLENITLCYLFFLSLTWWDNTNNTPSLHPDHLRLADHARLILERRGAGHLPTYLPGGGRWFMVQGRRFGQVAYAPGVSGSKWITPFTLNRMKNTCQNITFPRIV